MVSLTLEGYGIKMRWEMIQLQQGGSQLFGMPDMEEAFGSHLSGRSSLQLIYPGLLLTDNGWSISDMVFSFS
jgi:hypothetical protein